MSTIRLRRGTGAPSAGSFVEGEPAWDSANKKLYVKAADGSMAPVGGGQTYTYSTTAPTSPVAGDEWLDSDVGILYTYVNDGNSSAWVELGPPGSVTYSSLVLADYGLITEAVSTSADYGALV